MKVRDVMQRHVAVIQENESLGLAQQLMRWTEIRHLPVVRSADRRVIGVLSERDLLRAASEASATPLFMSRPVRELMSSPAEHIHPNAELADAAADMATKKLGCLPVIEVGELVGLITRADVLSVLAQYPVDGPPEHVSHASHPPPPPTAAIMYPEPIAVRANELLVNVAARMGTVRARHACVVDSEGKVIGMVSDRDVRRVLGDPQSALEVARFSDKLGALRVEAVMTRDLKTIDQDEPFTNALTWLVDERIGALPVVDGHGRLRGILSYVDVLKALAMYVPSA